MKAEENFIAFCGLNCETCDARAATLNNDQALREKTAKLWSEMNGVEITAEMINCTGCRSDGPKTPYCESICPIKQCAIGRKYDSCGKCKKMDSCQKLKMIITNNQEALGNLRK